MNKENCLCTFCVTLRRIRYMIFALILYSQIVSRRTLRRHLYEMCVSTFRRSQTINSVFVLATELRLITTSIIFFSARVRGNGLLVCQKRTCWNRSRLFFASARTAHRTLDFAEQSWQEILDTRTSLCKMSAIFVRFRRESERVNTFL